MTRDLGQWFLGIIQGGLELQVSLSANNSGKEPVCLLLLFFFAHLHCFV
jgi:hypothetical protein